MSVDTNIVKLMIMNRTARISGNRCILEIGHAVKVPIVAARKSKTGRGGTGNIGEINHAGGLLKADWLEEPVLQGGISSRCTGETGRTLPRGKKSDTCQMIVCTVIQNEQSPGIAISGRTCHDTARFFSLVRQIVPIPQVFPLCHCFIAAIAAYIDHIPRSVVIAVDARGMR